MAVRKAGSGEMVGGPVPGRPVALLFVAGLDLALPHALCSAIATFSRFPEELGLGLSSVQADSEELLLLGKVAVFLERVPGPSAAVRRTLPTFFAPEPFEVVALEAPHQTEQQQQDQHGVGHNRVFRHHPVNVGHRGNISTTRERGIQGTREAREKVENTTDLMNSLKISRCLRMVAGWRDSVSIRMHQDGV